MPNYFTSVNAFVNQFENKLEKVMDDVTEEVLGKLQELIETHTYTTTPTEYDRTREFLHAFVKDTVTRSGNSVFSGIDYDTSDMTIGELGGYDGFWLPHASALTGEDVSDELYLILNVDGSTSGLNGTQREPYLDIFYKWLDEEYNLIVNKYMSKYGLV